jgi:YidC/Oxa1 family membrane protein insertase
MNDIRRTILWVIFGFSMVLLWDQWQVHNGQKATFFPNPAQQTAPAPGKTSAVDASVPTAVAVAAAPSQAVVPVSAPIAPKERFEVVTDVLKLTFETEGGSLVRAELLKYSDTVDKSRNFVLLDDSKDRVYLAQTGVIAAQGVVHFRLTKRL